jgi:hypothetical protein
MNEPLVVDTPAALMCQDLVQWQATGPTTPSLDLDAVLTAAQPLLSGRFAWSVSFTGDGSADFPVAQHIALLHVSGASLSTVVHTYPDGLGVALAGLLGLRVHKSASVSIAAGEAAASAALDRLIEQSAAQVAELETAVDAGPQPISEAEPSQEPGGFMSADDDYEVELSEADRKTCLSMLKALPADARRRFTIAFRSHFEVDESVKQVGSCITQRKHLLFVQDFIDEMELQGDA